MDEYYKPYKSYLDQPLKSTVVFVAQSGGKTVFINTLLLKLIEQSE